MILSNTLTGWSKIVKNLYSDLIHEYYVNGFKKYVQNDSFTHFYDRDLHIIILNQAIEDVANLKN